MTAELSSLAPNAILSDAAKYFKMTEQAALANNLTSYLSVASEPLSIVLGMYVSLCGTYVHMYVKIMLTFGYEMFCRYLSVIAHLT